MPPEQPKYRRVMLKISGEGFCKPGGNGLDAEELERIAREIIDVVKLGAQLAVVVGGGNFLRGSAVSAKVGLQEVTAHYMGMIATVINALALQDTLERMGVETRVQSAIQVDRVCEKFILRRSLRHLEKGRVLILASGTGNPFFTTDTCAALRAVELNADVLLKATKVNGVYDADPEKVPDARFYDRLGYNEVIDQRLAVMDLSAVDMCQRKQLPILVFNLKQPGNMRRAVLGREPIGTLIAGN
ncbi:MAG: UMP kinase [Phycisphaerae bacterium]|nr:UMP kinase [Phycisphaerae bacterium]